MSIKNNFTKRIKNNKIMIVFIVFLFMVSLVPITESKEKCLHSFHDNKNTYQSINSMNKKITHINSDLSDKSHQSNPHTPEPPVPEPNSHTPESEEPIIPQLDTPNTPLFNLSNATWVNVTIDESNYLPSHSVSLHPTSPSGGGNDAPIADASAGEPYEGFVNETLFFDGSDSYDPDGQIVGYRWDFNNDGTYDTGWLTSPTLTHIYSTKGTYTITLQVKDNDGATDTDRSTAVITRRNHLPTNPLIQGPTSGHKNINYEFTALSFDTDGDMIQYIFDWGDGEITRTAFLQNGTSTLQTHQWEQYGEYHILVKAFDNINESGTTMYTIFIDVMPINDRIKGYLIDKDSENTYDVFNNTNTGQQTRVKKENDTYLIDINGDGKWDYAFNLKTGLVLYRTYVYQKYLKMYVTSMKTPGFEVLSVLAMIGISIIILKKRR